MRFVRSFVRSSLRPSARSFVGRFTRNKQKILEWESTVAIAETISCEHDHDRKTSGVPLVIVSANDACSSHFYFEKFMI